MKTLAAIALILMAPTAWAGDWSTGDTARQAALTTLFIADWAQTRTFIKNPDKYPGRESNPILGPHPSVGRATSYSVLCILGHGAISALLPPDLRAGWQYVWIVIEADTVLHNHSAGIRIVF